MICLLVDFIQGQQCRVLIDQDVRVVHMRCLCCCPDSKLIRLVALDRRDCAVLGPAATQQDLIIVIVLLGRKLLLLWTQHCLVVRRLQGLIVHTAVQVWVLFHQSQILMLFQAHASAFNVL